MATLVALTVRHERRVRALFDTALAAGAFVPGPYTVTCTNARGPDPAVSAVLAVSGQTNAAELALASDLVEGGVYALACAAVPALDASTYTGTASFTHGVTRAPMNVEPAARHAERLLYGIDLVWSGEDFVETADGDLATVEGLPNVHAAVRRRLLADGLPWDPSYGARTARFVDAPAPLRLTLRGALVAAARADDRVRSVDVAVSVHPDTPADPVFEVKLTLLGDRRPEVIPVSV